MQVLIDRIMAEADAVILERPARFAAVDVSAFVPHRIK